MIGRMKAELLGQLRRARTKLRDASILYPRATSTVFSYLFPSCSAHLQQNEPQPSASPSEANDSWFLLASKEV